MEELSAQAAKTLAALQEAIMSKAPLVWEAEVTVVKMDAIAGLAKGLLPLAVTVAVMLVVWKMKGPILQRDETYTYSNVREPTVKGFVFAVDLALLVFSLLVLAHSFDYIPRIIAPESYAIHELRKAILP